jgi:hypothetical protein
MLTATHDNLFLAIGAMAVPFMALSAVWALLMMAFPRSGGDTMSSTRGIDPVVGSVTDFLYVAILPSVFPVFVVTIARSLRRSLFDPRGFF